MMGLVRALQIGPVLGAIPPGCAVDCDCEFEPNDWL